jgi:serine/threonine-protein kinase RsbW
LASRELRFCMAVDAVHLRRSRQQVRSFLQEHGVEEETAFDILICVNEACANAVEHSASASDVEVAVCLDESRVSIVVSDRGRGLDVVHHANHHKPALLSSGGRGLYVISRLMDEVDVHIDGGTEIRMVKRLI